MATEEGARDLPVYMTPDAELSRARHFLTGWTLARYASRFRADQRLREGDDEDDDGVTPPPAGGGAFGWTKTGPPGAAPRSARRRRPEGVLTIPSSATVGQALRDLAAADVLAAPAVDAATGDYVGWITCGSLLRQILRALYPRLLAPELLAQDDLEAFLYRSDDPADPSPDAPTVLAAMISEAETQFTSAWARVVRVGDDGDACFLGFADTTLLDFISRGLDARPLSEKRPGDFEPCHRVGVYTEPQDETVREPSTTAREREYEDEDAHEEVSSSKPNPAGDDEDAEGLDIRACEDRRPRWVAVVSQLDVVSLMAADADQLGAFPHVTTMETLGFAASSWGVVAVTSELPTAACFAIMNNCEVSGVPVLDARGRFAVGSLSVSDARRFDSPESLRLLAVPVGEFLRERVWAETPGEAPKPPPGAPERPRGAPDEPPGEPPEREGVVGEKESSSAWGARVVSVRPESTLVEAMRTMARARVHRVYVSESPHAVPRGVCTCTDIMRIFATDPETAEGRARLTW